MQALTRSSMLATRGAAVAAASSSSVAAPACAVAASSSSARRGMAGMAGRDVRMRVVLRADSHLGSEHDVVSVRRGYGRNVLVRKGAADYATAENLALSAIKQQQQKEEALQLMARNQAGAGKATGAVVGAAAGGAAGVSSRSAAASAASLSNLLLSPEARRYHADVVRRLSNQRPLVFVRPSIDARDQHTLASPLKLKEVFAKLGPLHPSINIHQLELSPSGGSASGTAQAITRFGDHAVAVDIPGQEKLIYVPVVVTRDVRAATAKPKTAAATAAAPL